MSEVEHGWVIGSEQHPEIAHIKPDDHGRWFLESGGWHCHLDADQVRGHLLGLLRGTYAIVEQFRGEQKTAAWTEYPDGLGDVSFNLNPFDSEEWIVRPGEPWVQVSRRWAIFQTGPDKLIRKLDGDECIVSTVETNEPEVPQPWMTSYLTERLGPPEQGWHWSSIAGNRCAFLVPDGYRVSETTYEPVNRALYQHAERTSHIWVTVGFQPDPAAMKEPRRAPQEAEHAEVSIGPLEDSEWVRGTWSLYFRNGMTRMLAKFDVQDMPSTAEHPLIAEYERLVHRFRMMTPDEGA